MTDLSQHLSKTGTELVEKPDYQVWWHAVAAWVMRSIFAALRTVSDFDRSFDRDFYTTLGSVIYYPAGQDIALEQPKADPEIRAIVAHELAHRYQDERRGWLGHRLPYIVSRRYRARAELEAIGVEMRVLYEETGELPEAWLDRKVQTLASAAYLWPIDEETARATLEGVAGLVRNGRLQVINPTASGALQSTLRQHL